MKPIIVIPARMASTRLPNKPMADIAGEPMIVQVWRRAMESKIGEVVVACDGKEIADAVERAGGKAVLTDPDLPSGSDRIHQALTKIDKEKKYDVIINLQGDMPTLDPAIIGQGLALLQDKTVDIATLAAPFGSEEEKSNPAVVKVGISSSFFSSPLFPSPLAGEGRVGGDPQRQNTLKESPHPNLPPQGGKGYRALYFSRHLVPTNGTSYHHIGIYFYQREALEKFVKLPPSPLEKREKLEQLRAVEAGMSIAVAVVDTVPLGVDTPETLEKARLVLNHIPFNER